MAAVLVTILFEATLPETDKLNPSEIEFADENRVGLNCVIWTVVIVGRLFQRILERSDLG